MRTIEKKLNIQQFYVMLSMTENIVRCPVCSFATFIKLNKSLHTTLLVPFVSCSCCKPRVLRISTENRYFNSADAIAVFMAFNNDTPSLFCFHIKSLYWFTWLKYFFSKTFLYYYKILQNTFIFKRLKTKIKLLHIINCGSKTLRLCIQHLKTSSNIMLNMYFAKLRIKN